MADQKPTDQNNPVTDPPADPAPEAAPANPSAINADANDKAAEDAADVSAINAGKNEENADDDKAAPTVEPLTLDKLTLPEGANISEEGAAPFLEIMNDAELSGEDRANKLLTLFSSELDNRTKQITEQGDKDFVDMTAGWLKDLKSDKDIGNANLGKTLAGVNELIDQHGSKDFRDLLDLTGAGSNIHMVRFLNSIHKSLGEASPLDDTGGEQVDAGDTTPQTRLYG